MDRFFDIIEHDAWLLAPLALFGFLTVAAIADVLGKSARSRHRERSRREIAAYIAEGSMSADEGQRLLEAGSKKTA